MPLYSVSQSHIIDESTKNYFTSTSPRSWDPYPSENVTEPTTDYHHLRDPLFVAVPLTFLYSFLLITGLAGNVITCVVILKNKYLHTATNYYLFSLAVSDLLLLIFGLPLEIYYIWRRYPFIFGETFCVMRGLMAETSTNASVLTITAFTVERYVAIYYPLFSYTLSNLSRAIKLIVGIWITSVICAIPQAIQFGVVSSGGPEFRKCTMIRIVHPYSFELSTLIFFIIPMIIITILYLRIGVKLKNSAKLKEKRALRPMLTPEHQQNSSQKLLAPSGQPSRKILKMLVAVVITFFICWAPFHIQRLVGRHSIDPGCTLLVKIYDVVTYISAILFYLSTTVNPILYHTMSHKFRDAFKETAGELCCKNNSHNSKFQRHKSSQLYHNAHQRRFYLHNTCGVEYSPNIPNRVVREEIAAAKLTPNCNNVNLTQLDLSNSVIPAVLDPVDGDKISCCIENTSDEKEIEKKKVIVWCNNNNNDDNITTVDDHKFIHTCAP